MRKNKSRADQLLSEIQLNISCPPATQSIEINLKNRQKCVDVANYGPANPDVKNEEFWQNKANLFKTSIEQAKTMRCKNCAAFIQKERMMECIQKGIASEIDEEKLATEIVDTANLGYCELFDFKCAGNRTCDAWIVGGPIK